jgi:hypothetical protein
MLADLSPLAICYALSLFDLCLLLSGNRANHFYVSSAVLLLVLYAFSKYRYSPLPLHFLFSFFIWLERIFLAGGQIKITCRLETACTDTKCTWTLTLDDKIITPSTPSQPQSSLQSLQFQIERKKKEMTYQ